MSVVRETHWLMSDNPWGMSILCVPGSITLEHPEPRGFMDPVTREWLESHGHLTVEDGVYRLTLDNGEWTFVADGLNELYQTRLKMPD